VITRDCMCVAGGDDGKGDRMSPVCDACMYENVTWSPISMYN
jgi:hypothetical protein